MSPPRTGKGRAARKDSPSHRKVGLKVGDRVKILDISPDLKNPNYDLKDAEHREMRTAELFRFCLGREFTIRGFGQYGHVELRADEDRAVRKEFGKHHSIWMEPEFLRRIQTGKSKGPRKRQTH